MEITPLSHDECLVVVAHVGFGRLGCSQDNQPYVVPIFFAYEDKYLYVLSTHGKKIEWMRANPKVCVQVDEIELKGKSKWVSVLVNGEYQELPEPQFEKERKHAHRLLQARPGWWVNVFAERRTSEEDDQHIVPLYFRIRIESTSGLRAIP